MKLDRMMAILTLLQNREWMQAGDLAQRFEVSVRTIYRDVDALNLAGIPIETRQGSGGGIRIMPGFRLDASLLTENDITDVVTALKSLATAMPRSSATVLLEKLDQAIPPARRQLLQRRTNEMIIDMSPWGEDDSQREKLALVRDAIEASQCLVFDYQDGQGERSRREVEPHTLVYKGMNWYLFAWCRRAEAFRTFRLSRMSTPERLACHFTPRGVLAEDRPWHAAWVAPDNNLSVVLRITPQAMPRAGAWFDVDQIEDLPDGSGSVRLRMPDTPWLDSWVLGFGAAVEVIGPPALRERILQTVRALTSLYGAGI